MTTLSFTIVFKTPFAVMAGHTSDGLDARVDAEELLPASSLKGLLRAEARELRISTAELDAIFGGGHPAAGAGWAWTDAVFEPGLPIVDRRAHVKIVGEGRSDEGSLLVAEYVWADRARFDVVPLLALPSDVKARHEVVLRAAARSVTSLGTRRRRGQGWVSITDSREWTAADTRALSQPRKPAGHE